MQTNILNTEEYAVTILDTLKGLMDFFHVYVL